MECYIKLYVLILFALTKQPPATIVTYISYDY